MEENSIDKTNPVAAKIFSRIGIALAAMVAVGGVAQVLAVIVPRLLWGEEHWLLTSSWGMWLATFVPVYCIAVPVGLLILRRIPAESPKQRKLGAKDFIIMLLISFCLMYAGNLIGTALSFLLSGGTAQNAILDYAMDNNPLKILVMVILAPLLEEYVFRKRIIDSTRLYGEKIAVLFSGLTFAMFHLNLFQFFYAFALGLVFAYIYVRTGKLRYSVWLHGIINFMGSVAAPFILSLIDLEALEQIDPAMETGELMALYGDMMPGLLIYVIYIVLLLGVAITGLVFLIIRCRRLIWRDAALELPKKQRIKPVYLNAGMILYSLLCLGLIIMTLL